MFENRFTTSNCTYRNKIINKAYFRENEVTKDDIVFADDDGVLFTPISRIKELISTAQSIWQTERRQAEAIREGKTLYVQLQF